MVAVMFGYLDTTIVRHIPMLFGCSITGFIGTVDGF